VPTSPLGARTVSPVRIDSGDPFVVIEVDRDPTGEDEADAEEDNDFRPPMTTALRVDVVDKVGEVSAVPIDTRGGRDNLLPPPPVSPLNVDGLPIGVGVEYISSILLLVNFPLSVKLRL
jgi:hypothetical protein